MSIFSIIYTLLYSDRLRAGNVGLSHLYCTVFTYHAVEKDFENKDAEDDDDDEEYEDENDSYDEVKVQNASDSPNDSIKKA